VLLGVPVLLRWSRGPNGDPPRITAGRAHPGRKHPLVGEVPGPGDVPGVGVLSGLASPGAPPLPTNASAGGLLRTACVIATRNSGLRHRLVSRRFGHVEA